MTQKNIEIIIPFLNEEKNLEKLIVELRKVILDSHLPYKFSFLFVDDGSDDESLTIIKRLMKDDERIGYLSLSRNFGKENALTAGLDFTKSDAAILIDADLQHPPELIPSLVKCWEEGADIAVAIKKSSGGRTFFKKYGAKFFYYFLKKWGKVDFVPHNTDFRLIDRKVINELIKIREHNRLFRGLVDWVGFNKKFVEFVPNLRLDGEVRYSYMKLFDLALNGFISFSQLPLKIIIFIGLLFLGFNFLFGLFISGMIYNFLTLFLLSLIVVILGTIALYLSAIYQNSTLRPLYIVKDFKAPN